MNLDRDIVACRDCARCQRVTIPGNHPQYPPLGYWTCTARRGLANLKSFPFMVTTCAAFTASETPHLSPEPP